MGGDALTLVVLYSNLATQKIKVTDRDSAKRWVNAEGDHIMDWYIEEDRNNERLRKESG